MPKTTFAPFAPFTPFAAMLGGLATVLTLAACAGNGQTPAAPGAPAAAAAAAAAPGGLCNAQPAQVVLGQSSTASVVESARARSGARMARILRPGQTITKEFNAQRLSLQVDGNGRIIAARCG
ncbi:proteinase inhibitor I78 [Verminephrobacter eiseniae]|uniref:I78 family peptidase inhibitor n=1 Tax=Verminephrobacter eiseniae TaxID=364317 RepID=UPI002236F428|nr:I78 family peptidase inhibitor [Verminephrobacter eiseniae]MCW5260220.1 proteinase inhibitor I78 [Verminephrobacter eiseniae]